MENEMSNKTIKNDSGFTILEIMIALLILAGGLMGAAAMQTRSVEDGMNANRTTRRITAAEDRIEDLYIKEILPTSENLDPFYNYNAALEPIDGDVFIDNTSPYYRVEYQSLGGDPLDMLTTIQVTVIPKAEGDEAAVAKRTLVVNYIRSNRYQ